MKSVSDQHREHRELHPAPRSSCRGTRACARQTMRPRDEDGQHRNTRSRPGTDDAAEDHFAGRDNRQGTSPPSGCVRIVRFRVDGAAGRTAVVTVARASSRRCRNGLSFLSMLPADASSRPPSDGSGSRAARRRCRRRPRQKRSAIAAKTAQPCRSEPVILPSVLVGRPPIAKDQHTSGRSSFRASGFVRMRGVGVEEAAAVSAELLMASGEATGPLRDLLVPPSSVCNATSAWKSWTTPRETKNSATNGNGQ